MSGIHSAPRGVLYCALAIAVAFLAGCGSSTSSGGTASGSGGTASGSGGTASGSGGTASSSGGTASSAPAPAAGSGSQASSSATITIKNFAFTTPPSVSPGAKVRVNNMDGLSHTVTADSGHAFDSPAPAGNSSFTAPTTPGSYPFHCSIHPEMHGVLVVK